MFLWLKIFLKEGIYYKNWNAVFLPKKIGGKFSLPNSIRKGFYDKQVDFIDNKIFYTKDVDTVYVAKDPKCVEWAIQLKKTGKIKRLVVGPMIVNSPSEYNRIIESPFIDLVLLPSQWIINFFKSEQERPDINYRIWPLGVDAEFWKPDPQKKIQQTFLVYNKNPDDHILRFVETTLKEKNISYILLKTGTFNHDQYKESLLTSRAVLFLSKTETQGLAMFEAWSCDKPTLHWNPGILSFMKLRYNHASSCPYLTNECGFDFKDQKDFLAQLDLFISKLDSFKPREFVLRNFTLEKSINQLTDHLSS